MQVKGDPEMARREGKAKAREQGVLCE